MPEELSAVGVTKQFGGLRALDQVSLCVPQSQIIGLIGPNGSGKTTLLNVISGVYPASAGHVHLNGRDISGLPQHAIARLGVARTFQHIRLFNNLTVLENVEVGASLADPNGANTSPRQAALAAIVEIGLHASLYRRAANLDYGAQRKLEIARALVSRPRFILLDEPAAGMNEAETEELLHKISNIRDHYQVGILVIDHDLSLIMRLCDRITVLNQGRVICEGPPNYVQNDPSVAEAYLGKRHPISV